MYVYRMVYCIRYARIIDCVGMLKELLTVSISSVTDGGYINRIMDQCAYLGTYLAR